MNDRLQEGRRQQERQYRVLESRINNSCHLSACCMRGTVLSTLHLLAHLVHTTAYAAGALIILILQMNGPDTETVSSLPNVAQLTWGAARVPGLESRQGASRGV